MPNDPSPSATIAVPLSPPGEAWFACHTRPRCEKKFSALMTAERFEHYLPLVESVRRNRAEGVIFAMASFCDPALLDRPMLQKVLKEANIPYIAFKYAENSGQMQPVREQAGTFADSIKLWSGA